MKQKKVPMRMCIGCRTMKPKRELARMVRNADDTVTYDATGKAPGRGAYVCRDRACLDRAVKIRAVEHALGLSPTQEALETLAGEIADSAQR